MVNILKSKHHRWISGSLILIIIMSSCTTIPSINRSWIASNCTSVGFVRSDSENQHSLSSGDNWEGSMINGKKHGLGTYTWANDGSYFHGEFNMDTKWCGVEARGSDFFVYKNGDFEQGQAGVDWGTVAAVIIVAGVVAAAASAASDGGGGGYSAPASDYDWDWDAFNDQYYNLQWRCRGIQTGEFADNDNCAFDYKDDDRWPEK